MVNIHITGRHMDVTEAMRDYVEKKLIRLQKFYNRISEMEVVVEAEGLSHKMEIIIKADNHQRFVVQHTAEDAYACFDTALDKIERRLNRFKEKSRDRKKRIGAAEATVDFMETHPSEETDETEQE
ncbi:MAG: ribosome-associated translation inhibitor RaiA [Sedimentisphaerales bacterium]|nr:ribosome-associated translation inhibitor RaiA [Sedimentisphaerales bacterium]